MSVWKKTLLILTLFVLIALPIWAQEETDGKKSELEQKIEEYEKKLVEIQAEKNTLSSQIEYMDTQIYLTELRMNETEADIVSTEDEINILGARIDKLDSSLDDLSNSLIHRIHESYKSRRVSIFDILLDSGNASSLAKKLKYYTLARQNNQRALFQVQESKQNFEEQKGLREKKVEKLDQLKVSLDTQQATLSSQQEAKEYLLKATQNDEIRYQELLAQARTEYAAIQNIVAGAGKERFSKSVQKGERIASVISGASCNSTGTHLHFIVQEGGSVTNPFNYLKDIDHVDYAGDPWTPSGPWDWPLLPKIQYTQGYGVTNAIRNLGLSQWYPFHNGIDFVGSSSTVYSVADGDLYQGSYTGANGCALPYVKVKHKDSEIVTLYLHVYY